MNGQRGHDGKGTIERLWSRVDPILGRVLESVHEPTRDFIVSSGNDAALTCKCLVELLS